MSNALSAFGLAPVQHISGAPWNGQTRKCWIESGHSGALYIGDPVVLTGSADPTTAAYPTIGIATTGASNPIFGVIVAFDPLPTNLEKNYWATTDTPGRACYVCCDPTVLYEIQGNADAAIAYTDVGGCANIVSGTPSTVTGLSGWVLDQSSITTTSNLQVRIMGAVDRADNDISSVYARWLVLININQLFTPATNASAGSTQLGGLGV